MTVGQATQLVTVFAKQTLRFRGAARFGAATWGKLRTAQIVV